MDIGIVSSRYAKALLRFADENEEAKQVYQEMQQMVASFTHLPMLTHALQNPTLSKEKKAMLLVAAAKTEQEVSISTKRFVELCISHRRENIMQFIATSYAAHYETANNILSGSLTLAHPVSEKLKENIQAIVEARTQKTIEMKIKIAPEIKGGFILQYGDNRLDASLKGQLETLRRNLVAKTN